MSRVNVVNIVLGIVFLALAGFGIYTASRWMMSDVGYVNVQANVDTWRDNRAVTSLEDWEQTREKLEEAISLHPEEPDNYHLLGLLYEWRGFAIQGETVTPEDLIESRRQAVDAYRQAAHLRPVQPDAWAHLARMKILAGERDEEFRMALRNTINQGPDEAGNILELAYITSLGWGSIADDDELRDLVVDTLVRGLETSTNSRNIFNYLNGTGAMEEVCPRIDPGKVGRQVQQACQTN